ncbi:hypothetical protein ES332_A07G019400v1 [Gossypium tomentosum]|uniref:Uncharacterized protein n=1 Tax=Gossypium tomentosum TaxID=34277 RepID=A0A5D2PMD6_GOSTO|nr:hypothetical protein ES332_A07G019400v1 [Gossypium tomentosum]
MRKIEVVCGRADVRGKLIMGATAPTAFRTLSVAGILCYWLRPFGPARELGYYNLGLFNFGIGFFLVLIIFAFMCVWAIIGYLDGQKLGFTICIYFYRKIMINVYYDYCWNS